MKNIIVLIIALFVAMVGFNNPVNAQTDKDEITVQVDGLGCPFCAYGLEKKFKEFKGIKHVLIDMETGILTFDYPVKDSLQIKQIKDKVVDAGYTPVSVDIVRANGVVETSKEVEVDTETADLVEMTLFVAGNCGMCQARIESTANDLPGVKEASWDKETKMLTLMVNEEKTSLKEITEAIAKAGHDTNTDKATDEAYDKLPGCCQYDRLND